MAFQIRNTIFRKAVAALELGREELQEENKEKKRMKVTLQMSQLSISC